MQVQKTGTPKQSPRKVILESELITAAVDRGVEGKIFKGFCSYTYRRHSFSISKSIQSSLDHHKYYYILYLD